MSSDQQRITEYNTDADAGGADGGESDNDQEGTPIMDWSQDTDSATHNACENCGGHLTTDYVRVYGDEDDCVHRCPQCSTQRERLAGKATDPDRDVDDYRGSQEGLGSGL